MRREIRFAPVVPQDCRASITVHAVLGTAHFEGRGPTPRDARESLFRDLRQAVAMGEREAASCWASISRASSTCIDGAMRHHELLMERVERLREALASLAHESRSPAPVS
jgi:alkylhydroperoxidase family enzyme